MIRSPAAPAGAFSLTSIHWTDVRALRSLSTDPIGYQDQLNLYAYVANDPVNATDPTGEEIQFARGSSSEFKKQVAAVVRKAVITGRAGDFAQIEKSKDIYTISEVSDQRNRYDSSNRTISWDPTSALETSDGGQQSPAIGLVHEAGHAANHDSNPAEYVQNTKSTLTNYSNMDEFDVIKNSENETAESWGESTRGDHFGTPYRVECEFCTEPIDTGG